MHLLSPFSLNLLLYEHKKRPSYIWNLPKKSKFSLYFILNGNTEITTLLFTWSFLVRFDFCGVFIGYNIGSKRSLHLENGLESYFNE